MGTQVIEGSGHCQNPASLPIRGAVQGWCLWFLIIRAFKLMLNLYCPRASKREKLCIALLYFDIGKVLPSSFFAINC